MMDIAKDYLGLMLSSKKDYLGKLIPRMMKEDDEKGSGLCLLLGVYCLEIKAGSSGQTKGNGYAHSLQRNRAAARFCLYDMENEGI